MSVEYTCVQRTTSGIRSDERWSCGPVGIMTSQATMETLMCVAASVYTTLVCPRP
jgi:hypothetical protein